MSTIRPCNACHYPTERDNLLGVAGPRGATGWYCKDTDACRARQNPTQKENDTMTLPQHSRFASWTPAAAESGDDYKARDHYGNHAIVKVLEYKPSVVTTNSPNGAPGIIVDVYDLNLKAAFRDVLMMTGAIVDTFKPHVGGAPLVVQWEKRTPPSGRHYPAPAPAVEAAIAAAEAVYAAGDPFAPTLGTIEEEAPF